jgi:hypothetical protein
MLSIEVPSVSEGETTNFVFSRINDDIYIHLVVCFDISIDPKQLAQLSHHLEDPVLMTNFRQSDLKRPQINPSQHDLKDDSLAIQSLNIEHLHQNWFDLIQKVLCRCSQLKRDKAEAGRQMS